LAAEVEAVQTYLKLEAIRLEDRLRVKLDIAPGVLDIQVPPMLVQTLVENAVKHGISRLSAGGEISIHAAEANGALHVEVVNSGQLATSGDTQLGLKNVRERLRLLFGEQAKLTLRNLDPDNVIAEVVIPHAHPAH
jgi:LytS/YehU family sensor histidine kinase